MTFLRCVMFLFVHIYSLIQANFIKLFAFDLHSLSEMASLGTQWEGVGLHLYWDHFKCPLKIMEYLSKHGMESDLKKKKGVEKSPSSWRLRGLQY